MRHFKEYTEKLRFSELRPTKQRLMISKILFDQKETFHFTIESLNKKIKRTFNENISLATLYNTVHVFTKKGYIKKISFNEKKSYYDTNVSPHHHFYDEETHELIDCNENDIDSINVKKNIPGKKIKSLEVLIKVASDNQNQN